MKEKNLDYVIRNFRYGGNVVDWLMSIKHFFGEEQTEEFCDYFINAHHIMRKSDIRNLISSHSLSVYSMSHNEQLAFISSYKPINRAHALLTKMPNGFKKAQGLYRKKSIQLSKRIKQLGYSYSVTEGNWKDKNGKDTYQQEYVFIVYSEYDTEEHFKENMVQLARECKMPSVIITEKLKDDSAKLQINAQTIDTLAGKAIQQLDNVSIDIIERHFEKIAGTKFLFELPYERNKKVLFLESPKIGDYYSREKQERIKKRGASGFAQGMLLQSLKNAFSKENYNE